MAKLSTKARQQLPSSSFALPGKGTGKGGKGAGSYPIPDIGHGRNALSRVSAHGTPEEKKIVRAKVHRKFPSIGGKQFGGMVPRAPRAPKLPSMGPLVGARPPRAPRGLSPRIGGRLSSAAGMHKGGVAGVSYAKKPHTYASGGVVPDRIGREALTGKREMTPKTGSRSGDQAPATCGSLKGHSGFAAFGIKRSH